MNQSSTYERIPQFETLEEEAAFWDTHDTTEFEDEFESVEATFAQPLLRRGLTVPLNAQAIELLGRLATKQKTDPADLARLWIMDRLQVERTHSARPVNVG
jgi:hypothetical protein